MYQLLERERAKRQYMHFLNDLDEDEDVPPPSYQVGRKYYLTEMEYFKDHLEDKNMQPPWRVITLCNAITSHENYKSLPEGLRLVICHIWGMPPKISLKERRLLRKIWVHLYKNGPRLTDEEEEFFKHCSDICPGITEEEDELFL